MTVRLDVRFIKLILLDSVIQVQSLKSKQGMYLMLSSIIIDGLCYSTAEAKFMQCLSHI